MGIRHGTTSGYSHYKCRCDECRQAVAAYARKRNAARRAGTWQPQVRQKEQVPCSFPGCTNVARYRPLQLCPGHYEQRRRGRELRPLLPKFRVVDGKKVCTACGVSKSLDDYVKKSSALDARPQSKCRDCLAIYVRARRLGVTFDQIAKLAKDPCQGCGREVGGRGQHIDHDHDTGEIRGVLCRFCNASLTKHMTPEILRRLADYLESAHLLGGSS